MRFPEADFYGIIVPAKAAENKSGKDIMLFQNALFRVLGFNMSPSELYAFELKHEKIPYAIWEEILMHFRKDTRNEAIVRVLYDNMRGYYLQYPEEENASKAYVTYAFPYVPGTQIVLTIHSHNTMPAFFSKIDDADERVGFGIYGVVGRLDLETPQTRFRVCINGDFLEIPLEQLFEIERSDLRE